MKLRLPSRTDGLLVILKLAGETCNINCHYCYEKRKPYAHHLVLSVDILRRFLRHCGDRPLHVVLHGGEPLIIGRQRMTSLIDVLREYPGKLELAIQTNGTLLDAAWLDYWEETWPAIEIGVSLDGDPDANRHRVDYRDRPTYALVESALQLLASRGRTVGVIAVVTRASLGRARAIVENVQRFPAVRTLKLSPCLDINVRSKEYRTPSGRSIAVLNPNGQGIPGWGTTPAEYTEFLIDAWHAWRETGAFRQFMLEPLYTVLRVLAGRAVGFSHFSDRKEPYIVTLYPDGRIGSSDELAMPLALLSHIDQLHSDEALDRLLALETNQSLRGALQRLLSACDSCPYASTCRGGSLADRLRYSAAGLDAAYCDSRGRLIDFVAQERGRLVD